MTEILIENNDKEIILKAKGHANYDTIGKDIVCSSISSLILHTLKGFENELESVITGEISSADINVKIIKNEAKNDIYSILINMLKNSLEDLKKQFPDNLKLEYK